MGAFNYLSLRNFNQLYGVTYNPMSTESEISREEISTRGMSRAQFTQLR